MNSPAIPIAEFDLEMQTTRRLIQRVPGNKLDWKPHVKSFSLGNLAQLLSWMPGWIEQALHKTELDLLAGDGYGPTTPDVLMQDFEKGVAASRTALLSVTGAALQEVWTLRRGSDVLWSAPRREVVRAHLNHLIHHRGQFTVYLRMVDVPLPSIYGPTADEKW